MVINVSSRSFIYRAADPVFQQVADYQGANGALLLAPTAIRGHWPDAMPVRIRRELTGFMAHFQAFPSYDRFCRNASPCSCHRQDTADTTDGHLHKSLARTLLFTFIMQKDTN